MEIVLLIKIGWWSFVRSCVVNVVLKLKRLEVGMRKLVKVLVIGKDEKIYSVIVSKDVEVL